MASSYRDIFKGTAVFGGTQIIQVLVGLIRSKVVSVLIGARGMGINSLYTSSLLVVTNFAGMGLKDTSVRNIAIAAGDDNSLLARRLSVINKCFVFSYIVGILATIALSPVLSQLSFKCFDYTINYGFLSLYVLFQLQFQYYIAILQGFRKFKKLASASISSAVIGLLVSSALYYFWGIKGIVPNIIITSFVSMLCVRIPVMSMHLPSVKIGFRESIKEGKEMITFGIVLVISVLIGNGINYAINTVISHYGQVEDIGLFQAALNITTQSVSLIFASMTADYYPRLARVCNDKVEMNKTVNRQSAMIANLGLPILCMMVVFSELIIRILLTEEFLPISIVLKLLCVGTMFQFFSYPIGNISFAKGDRKFFFFFEAVLSGSLKFLAYCIGYVKWGLVGLAWGVIASYSLYFFIILCATRFAYCFRLEKGLLLEYVVSVVLFLLLVWSSTYLNHFPKYIIEFILASIICIYNFKGLNDKLDIKQFVSSKLHRRTDESA